MNGAQQSTLIGARAAPRRRSTRSPSRSAPRSATRARRPTPRSSRSPARCRSSSPPTSSGTRASIPFIKHALDDDEIGGQRIAQLASSCPTSRWLAARRPSPTRSTSSSTSGGGGGSGEPTAPGLHGTGLDSTSVGDIDAAARRPNRLTARRNRRSPSSSRTRARTTSPTSRSRVRDPAARRQADHDPKTVAEARAAGESATVEHPARRRTPPLGAAGDDPRRRSPRCRARRRPTTTGRRTRRCSSAG